MNERTIWKETKYKFIIGKYILFSLVIIPLILAVVGIIEVMIFGRSIKLLALIGVGGMIITIVAILYGGLTNHKKKIGYNSNSMYYIDRDGRKEKLRFSDINYISVPSQEDSAIIVKTKRDGDDRRVIFGPGTGGKYGKSLIEEYKRWIEENTDKEASVEFVSYDIPFLDWGKYVIDLHEDQPPS